MPISNYEDVSIYPLDPDRQELLLRQQNEAAFVWGTKDHWPVGVMMSYVWRDGRFWLTATTQRKRIAAIRRDPRVSVVVSGIGTEVGKATTVTAKGRCILHDDDETKRWFYPAIAEAVMEGTGPLTDRFAEMLDSERRVIIEVVPEKWITYDATKLMADSIEAWTS
jgi:nitroimidazol reductase NimA-like FMN-containing flavoprotein (pyridoxamine 5'-phosphate oxidase superfamily)